MAETVSASVQKKFKLEGSANTYGFLMFASFSAAAAALGVWVLDVTNTVDFGQQISEYTEKAHMVALGIAVVAIGFGAASNWQKQSADRIKL